MTSSIW